MLNMSFDKLTSGHGGVQQTKCHISTQVFGQVCGEIWSAGYMVVH